MERSGCNGWLEGGQHFGELNAGREEEDDDRRQLAISIKQVDIGSFDSFPGDGEKIPDMICS